MLLFPPWLFSTNPFSISDVHPIEIISLSQNEISLYSLTLLKAIEDKHFPAMH
jgi:hypothetical protein